MEPVTTYNIACEDCGDVRWISQSTSGDFWVYCDLTMLRTFLEKHEGHTLRFSKEDENLAGEQKPVLGEAVQP